MIQQFFTELGPWAWIILGLVLLVLEIVSPGTMFLWFGIAALIVGCNSFLIDIGWQSALILFGFLSLVSVIVGRQLVSRFARSRTDKPLLNERSQALVGHVYELEEAIENGQGRVKVHDSYWRVAGPDAPQGSKVRVIGGEGTLLRVEPAKD